LKGGIGTWRKISRTKRLAKGATDRQRQAAVGASDQAESASAAARRHRAIAPEPATRVVDFRQHLDR